MTDFKDLIQQLRSLETEKVNPDTVELDRLSSLEICKKINQADAGVADVVQEALPQIAAAAERFAETLRAGGRVIYVGAGTSGRLGVLDAAECPPTFGTDPEQIIGIIAGGNTALTTAIEGAEDDEDQAVRDLSDQQLTSQDFVIGLCASRRTPYTLAALNHAAILGCATAFIICNRAVDLPVQPDFLVELPVGPEVITGSTRMKSGTAQKMTLNMISTTAMVLLGKTFGNLMVDLQARSQKLAARSRRILMDLFGLTLTEADNLLNVAEGSVKAAIVMRMCSCTREEALRHLASADGFIYRISQ